MTRAKAAALIAAAMMMCACAAVPDARTGQSASQSAPAPASSSAAPSASSSEPSVAQVQATVHLQPDQPLQLDAVAMAGARHAWVGGNGAVFGTTDGGAAWTRLYTGTEAITELDFLDSEHGWAVAADALLGTADGGQTWKALGESAAAVASVDFVTPTVGYGVTGGRSGTAVKSVDGGRTWTALSVAGNVRSICFVNAQNGFALRTNSAAQPVAELLATGDGGASWHQVLAPAGLYDVVSAELGCSPDGGVWALLVAPQGMMQAAYGLYRSADGGSTWTVVAGGNNAGSLLWKTPPAGLQAPVPGPGAQLAAVSAQTAVLLGNCPACEGDGTVSVARSTDGGGTWQGAPVPGVSGAYGRDAMAFADPEHGLLVAAPSQGTTEVLATSNGGATWTRVFDRQNPAPTDAISFMSAQLGYGLGSSADPAAVLRTSDGGVAWTTMGNVPDGNKGQIYGQDALAFTDAEHGWAITAAQTLARTTNGGRTWVPAAVPNGPGAVAGVAFVDARHGCILAAGPAGGLWSTSSGGATWAAVPQAQAQALRSAAGLSGHEALLCASAVANPGWIANGSPTVGAPWLVGALDGQSRWLWFDDYPQNVAGVLATHDAGRSWTRYVLPNTLNEPRSISFVNAEDGWLLTQGDGRVLRTTDGGATWTQV